METININNYEAFYLDFLEGNLNEEETALLFVFLDENPELKLDETEFISLEDNSSILDNSYKKSLKQVVFEEETVTSFNINSFLIAQTENQLSTFKNNELEEFIALNPVYLKDQQLFKIAHLKANIEEIYTAKNELKQARKISLWPILSIVVAASVALLISFGDFFTTEPKQIAKNKASIIANDSIKKEMNTSEKSFEIKNNQLLKHEIETSTPLVAKNSEVIETPIIQNNKEGIRPEKSTVKRLKSLKIKYFQLDEEYLEPEKAQDNSKPIKVKSPENTYTNLGFNQMENPIMPITSKLSELVKKDVDFRSAKATSKHSGGFYIKIGKLVISHTKS